MECRTTACDGQSQTGVSRRAVLRGTAAAGAGAIVGAGRAATTPPDRHIVGTDSKAAVRAAESRADSVRRVLDFGDIGVAVAGQFPEQVLENLRFRADVRYVERDGTMHAIGGPGKDTPGGTPGPPGGGGGDTSQCLPWGVDRTDAGVAAAIIIPVRDERGYSSSPASRAVLLSSLPTSLEARDELIHTPGLAPAPPSNR